MKTLETFYLKSLQQILRVGWHQHITNSEILSYAGVGSPAEQIARQRTAACLADNVPARLALFPVTLGNVVLVTQGTDG